MMIAPVGLLQKGHVNAAQVEELILENWHVPWEAADCPLGGSWLHNDEHIKIVVHEQL